MSITITAPYVAILAVVSLALQTGAVKARNTAQVAVGDGGDSNLLLAMRRQLHFVETVPIALIVLVLLELNGTQAAILHSLGFALVIARILHPLGMREDKQVVLPRQIGAGITMLVTLLFTQSVVF